jgi:hypothetical protein
MTKKEAVETIKANRPISGYGALQEALDMAIISLERDQFTDGLEQAILTVPIMEKKDDTKSL